MRLFAVFYNDDSDHPMYREELQGIFSTEDRADSYIRQLSSSASYFVREYELDRPDFEVGK